MIVIGIDPGIANTGFGVVRTAGERMVALDGGVIETGSDQPTERRLAHLHDALGELIRWHEPKAVALEDVFFNRNVGSALSVGQARGVALLAAARHEVRCYDYTPQAVKKAVCGSGSAEKDQIQRMVASLLGLPEPPSPDHAADAFAVAICHAGTTGTRSAIEHFGRPRSEPPQRWRVSGSPDSGRRAAQGRHPGRGPESQGMIASVAGEVLVRRPDHVVIDANGVGYRLAVSAETLKSVPARGKETTLHAHLVAREDSLSLYGFASEEERDLFLHLISVGGVGPKVAMAALSGAPARELLRAIAGGDAKRFQAVPGIGKRTAERIIVELRERIAGEIEADADGPALPAGEEDPRAMAREGLLNLGYTPPEAEKLLSKAEGESAEEIVQSALRSAAGAKAA